MRVAVEVDLRVGDGSGPFCAVCGLDLSLSRDQIDWVGRWGNPIPRPSCLAGGLHRVPDERLAAFAADAVRSRS